MSTARFAMLVGLALGVVAALAGVGAFVVVALFAAVGWTVGLVLDGRLDLSALLGRAVARSTDRR